VNFSLKPNNFFKEYPEEAYISKPMEQVRERKVQPELFHIFLLSKYC
tara:strand:- start:458 stop:598 length:141 start_codon:yes stop_codon:yes gene_type:complete